jgi:hypothetical protein
VTNTVETNFPVDFLMSYAAKYIVVQHCRVIFKNEEGEDYLVSDIMVHCDFIERDHYLDYFACFSNTLMTKYKKFQVINPRKSFKVWFTTMDGKAIEPQSFVLELLLIF